MLHGHTFTVTATVINELMDEGVPRGSKGLEETLGAIATELDERPMSQMIPGVEPTLSGIAAFIFERLAHDFPGLDRVEVFDGTSYGAAMV
jgi:6-pyruvoyl-tetrahydropterin synthase